jgi:hypothetical protein
VLLVHTQQKLGLQQHSMQGSGSGTHHSAARGWHAFHMAVKPVIVSKELDANFT